jgi:hypothetical protein
VVADLEMLTGHAARGHSRAIERWAASPAGRAIVRRIAGEIEEDERRGRG